MVANIHIFQPKKKNKTIDLFEQFIEWGRPFGTAGINYIHKKEYVASSPFFDYSSQFIPHGHNSCRSWFLKYEFLGKDRDIFARTRGDTKPIILHRHGLISDGQYLLFAKSYLNIITYYRCLRSPSSTIVLALIFLEKAIRNLNNKRNDPSLINKYCFERANHYIAESNYGQGMKYDTAKDLEMLSGMLQSGYNTKSFEFNNKGFYLLDKNFSFKATIPNRQRKRAINRNTKDMHKDKKTRFTNETAAAVGLAYCKALKKYGKNNHITFLAAIAGIPLTTVSMRVSELITISRDALYRNEYPKNKRYSFRIERPKINQSQDLPIPNNLSSLTNELMKQILSYSNEAHKAFTFYIKKYGDNFKSIDELYIPNHLKKIFNKNYLSINDIKLIIGNNTELISKTAFPQQFRYIKSQLFIKSPGDIYPPSANKINTLYKISDIESTCKKLGIKTTFPKSIKKSQYINKTRCLNDFLIITPKNPKVSYIFTKGKLSKKYIKTSDLKQYLLNEFKNTIYPHWPYSTKDKITKLDNTLLVWFETSNNNSPSRTINDLWWIPTTVRASILNSWLSTQKNRPPLLFKTLDIHMSDGSYPSFTIHDTRKYHHTNALLAGANEIFIDKLAGRKSGYQSDHYDLRTPHEIITSSIETFDPNIEFDVVGPILDDAPSKKKIIERQVFLYENAAPKQLTDVGGCRTDWSINPCEQYGDCMRCDKAVWQKGDKKRLSYIESLYLHASEMILVGKEKLNKNRQSEPIKRHLQQYKDTVARCRNIFKVEKDRSIKNGTIITFSASKHAFSTSQLTQKLRNENCTCHNVGK